MKKKKFLGVMLHELKRMINKDKKHFIIIIIVGLVESVLLLYHTILLKHFFSRVTFAVDNHLSMTYALLSFFLLTAVILSSDILNAVSNFLKDLQRINVRKGTMGDFFSKISRLGVLDFENPQMLDRINKARVGVESSVSTLIRVEIILGNQVVYFALVLGYLSSIHPLLSTVMFCIFFPTFISYRSRNRIQAAAENDSAIYRRRVAAYELYIGDKMFFKETRHLNAVEFFKRKFAISLNRYKDINLKSFRKKNNIKLVLNLINFGGFVSIFIVLFYLTSKGEITVGETGAVLATVMLVYDRMNEFFNFQIAGLAESYNGVFNLNDFMGMEEKNAGEVLSEKLRNIELKNVYFKYPNALDYVLKDISLEIKEKEVIAIVGENGSGKTTLSKIICGLYEQSEGGIRLNGKSRDDLNRDEVLKNVTVVFQNFNKYALSLKENILISDTEKEGGAAISELLESVGMYRKALDLEQGMDSVLSKEFGGTDISIGQWQRLAIARAKHKKASMIIFDEPTASLDPMQEMEIMEKFIEEADDKTAVLVTHRIGAAKLADRIIVVKDGEIAQIGSHDELIKSGGEYSILYNSQKQWYI